MAAAKNYSKFMELYRVYVNKFEASASLELELNREPSTKPAIFVPEAATAEDFFILKQYPFGPPKGYFTIGSSINTHLSSPTKPPQHPRMADFSLKFEELKKLTFPIYLVAYSIRKFRESRNCLDKKRRMEICQESFQPLFGKDSENYKKELIPRVEMLKDGLNEFTKWEDLEGLYMVDQNQLEGLHSATQEVESMMKTFVWRFATLRGSNWNPSAYEDWEQVINFLDEKIGYVNLKSQMMEGFTQRM